MVAFLRKHFVALVLILVAVLAVGSSVYLERKAEARSYQYCWDSCNPNCWT
jgi:hypothetical protein